MTPYSRIGRRLRLRDLHIFLTVVNAGSMAQAAKQLNVTQPSISRAIRDLETELGVPLFERGVHGVSLTIYGNALLKSGFAAFDELSQGVRTIESLVGLQGELRVGCTSAVTALTILPTLVERFCERYPNARLHLDDVPSRNSMLIDLRDRKYDLGITRRTLTHTYDNEFHEDVLFHDRRVVVAGVKNPLTQKRKIKLQDLAGQSWILATAEPGYYAFLEEAYRVQGLAVPEPRLVTVSVSVRARLIANGPYLTVLPETMLPLLNAERQILKALPLDLNEEPWPVTVVHLKNRTLLPSAQKFIECARETAKELTKS